MNSAVSDSKLPPHAQIAGQILTLIKKANLRPGDKLPSEREISRELGVPHQQTHQAMVLLSREHHLERRVGSGTYLRSNLESLEASLAEWLRQRPSGRGATRVGVILLPVQNSFFTQIIEELHRMAGVRGAELLIRVADPTYVGLIRVARELAHDGCASVIFSQASGVATADLVRFALDSPLPVSLSGRIAGLEANFFEEPEVYDTYNPCIMRLAVGYFLEIGRTELAYFGPLAEAGSGAAERSGAFEVCASEHNLRVRFALLPPDPAKIDERLDQWRKSGAPDAVFCYDDDHALRLLPALQRGGWKVPSEISVIGVNDIPLAAHTYPALTSIHFDYTYNARGMLDHALARAGLCPPGGETHRKLGLVIRGSCGGKATRADGQLADRLTAACGMRVNLSYQ